VKFLDLHKNEIHRTSRKKALLFYVGICAVTALQACAPRQPYRPPLSSRGIPSRAPAYPQDMPPSRSGELQTRPSGEEANIREPVYSERAPAFPPTARESTEAPGFGREPSVPPLPDDSSLIAKITPGTTPRRAASLRLTDEGRQLIEAGDYAKALNRLEKTIAIDSTNAYGYYYLAKAHHHLGRHQESLNFLDVAESRLSGDPYWLAEVYALRGENFRALGFGQRAETHYAHALRLNPGNRTASEALGRMQGDGQPSRR
jgi:hypothetical protein